MHNARFAALRKHIRVYRTKGYRPMPWRTTRDPYRILVSEIMLQQTQVARVRDKYTTFIAAFPTPTDLAHAPLSAVLRAWQGLGYNRRARFLHNAAKTIVATHRGHVPRTIEELIALPGIGHATAGAICAYAYNQPVAFIETNVRTVFIHHFFEAQEKVSDRELLPLVQRAMDMNHPRTWYWALMDYGTSLKQSVGNVARKSRHYTKQSRFVGSDRQLRGQIIKLLLTHSRLSIAAIARQTQQTHIVIMRLAQQLHSEGLVVLRRSMLTVPS